MDFNLDNLGTDEAELSEDENKEEIITKEEGKKP